MILLDSNIIINSTKPGYDPLRRFLANLSYCISAISYVEVLGYHKLVADDKHDFEEFFALTPILPISDDVINNAVRFRQSRKMSLGDAIIAATAVVNGLELVTSNTKDFKWIDSLVLIDPLKDQ